MGFVPCYKTDKTAEFLDPFLGSPMNDIVAGFIDVMKCNTLLNFLSYTYKVGLQ